MSYITGTLTDSNAPATLYAAIATALAAEDYTLVDTVVIGTRTHKVWKSAAADNTTGKDWYLDVAYTTTGAGNIWFLSFENFDPATDLAYRGPYGASGQTAIDATYFSRFGNTGYALETNWAPSAAGGDMHLVCTATSFAYWISITPDRVIAMHSGETTKITYTGFYEPDPLYVTKAGAGTMYPLVSFAMTPQGGINTSGGGSGFTRLPPFTSLPGSSHPYIYAIGGAGASVANQGAILVSVPSGSSVFYPSLVARIQLAPNSSFAHRGRWGFAKDLYLVATDAGVSRGDTITIESQSSILTSSSSGLSLAFKAL